MVPLIAGMITPLLEDRFWTYSTYETAFYEVSEVLSAMATNCAQDITMRLDDLYRLIAAGIFGTVYESDGANPPNITPEIPIVPDMSYSDPGLIGLQDRLIQLTLNVYQGVATPHYSYSPSVKELLQQIIDKIQTDPTTNQDLLEELQAIALLLG